MSVLKPLSEGQITEHYDIKVIEMGDYVEIIQYTKNITRLKAGYELRDKELYDLKTNNKNDNQDKTMRPDNLSRTHKRLEQLVKTNEKDLYTFVTLTFAEELEYDDCNKKFSNWTRQVRRKLEDFKYIAVIEYHKNRDVIHFHLMTNLVPGSELMPKRKKKKLYDPKTKTTKVFDYYDLPYWNYGYSHALDLSVTDENFKPHKYMTKYLFKDADKRLYGRVKLRYSQNTIEYPKEKVLQSQEMDIQDLLDIYKMKYPNHTIKPVSPKRINGIPFILHDLSMK